MKSLFTIFLLAISQVIFCQSTQAVQSFDKVIVSPHIQTTFVEASEESVIIESISVDKSKLHIEVKDGVLRIYLEGAKEITKNEKDYESDAGNRRPVYTGTVVTAVITYKKLEELSLRGEEDHTCKSPLVGKSFRLKVYGASTVTMNEVQLDELETTIYGETQLNLKAGAVGMQRYVVYGEGKINSMAISGKMGKLTAYGEADFKMNVADEIKITAFGEASLQYKGNPEINKGLHFGELHISKLDD